MRRLLLLAVVAVVIVAAAVVAVIFTNAQNGQPPQIMLVYAGTSYSGALESYCWPNPPTNGSCTLPINTQRTDIPTPVTVSQNSSVTFQVVGYPDQTAFTVSIWTRSNGGSNMLATKHITSSLVINLPAGNYYLSTFTTWGDKRAVGYTYEIAVSS